MEIHRAQEWKTFFITFEAISVDEMLVLILLGVRDPGSASQPSLRAIARIGNAGCQIRLPVLTLFKV
ncbi:hypothetical protein E4U25_000318 [Claviceps purpurea]|nr:hypothetical protein E4U12_000355 [Claviceps purpurea]KAG6215577.1 hypothetical protein E4U26_008446 [Claviceps purpurea]KAG6223037.1 hypothetical protein E4U25_000318 [Claviceps purpurea]